jgi:hypothetical protein
MNLYFLCTFFVHCQDGAEFGDKGADFVRKAWDEKLEKTISDLDKAISGMTKLTGSLDDFEDETLEEQVNTFVCVFIWCI